MSLPKANKELGQHFLRDQKVISNITSNFHEECDVIIEVGPGPAILSPSLVSHKKPFYVIEMDTRFKEQLITVVDEDKIFFQDALDFNWIDFIIEHHLEDKKIWLVSNLPYNVSSPLYISFMQIPQIQYMTLMFQKEVGEKTYLRQNEKNQMSSLLSLSLNYFDCKQLMKVYPGAFQPPPKVDSVVVSYRRNETPIVPLSDFLSYQSFLRALFQLKRKQIGTVLKSYIPTDRKDEFFTTACVESTLRAEALKLEQVYALYKSYKTMK